MADSQSPSLSEILSQLEGKTTADSEKREVYLKFSRYFTEDEVSLFSLDVAKDVNHVINVIQRDVETSSAEVSQGALQVLCVCLHEQDIVRNISQSSATDVMKKLCACIHKTDDKTTCTRALWCLGKQNIAADIVKELVGTVLDAVDFAVEKWGGNSITVEHECVNTIARLTEQAPKEMTPQSARWGKVLLPLVAHNAIKVRERVLAVLEMTLDMLLANQKDLTASVVPTFKSKVCGELKKLLASKHEIYVLKCWGVLVQIFGEELHHGSFINSMLPIIELGFKGLAAETKMASFTAWQHLIDNFATNPSILSDPKRIKLLMQVFKMNNAKTEDVAKVKLHVWWHLIWLLGSKISTNFDAVAAPMLQFCVGGSKLGDHSVNTTPKVIQNGISPVTPRMNLTCPNSQWPVFKSLQLKGCEVLAHFLGSQPADFELPNHRFTLDKLRCEVITGPAMFVKNSSIFINTATELFISQGKDIPESLLFHIWYSLVAHMKNGIEGTAKLDMRETVTTFLTQFQVIILSRVLSNNVILKMFEGVCCLPKKVLCSSAYNIGGGEMIHGTPALFLMELLLTPSLLQSCPELDSYHSLYSTIVGSGLFNSSMSLGFLQAVLQILDQNASFVENSEMLWRFWSAVVQPLLEHITKTNEINQGDSLEHNFSCVYQALLFPLKHKLPSLIPQPTVKTLTKTWTELYKTVNRLAAMVTNAEANIVCEDVCCKIMELNKAHDDLETQLLEFEISICHVVITSLDFSSLGTQSTFGLSASPAKWTKRRQRSLENINSLVLLLSNLQCKATRLVSEAEANPKKSTVDKLPLQGMLNTMVDNFSMLFTHVSSSAIISAMIGSLAQPVGELFHDVARRTSVKVYNNAFQQKMEKLWMDITTCLQSRYQALFDSEFLQKLSPLLEATFLHSRRQIKNQTIALWNVTFGKAASLVYPEALKPVLSKVKDKSVISLPGWVAMAIPVIEETPISQMSQSQAPEPHIPGMPSPHKIHGSFLNKAVSPNIKKSPAKSMPSPKAVSAKKKVLGFDNFEEKDFVVIQSSPRKPRVLTDHQKEVMKERRILPAMYNSLENSQDVSMMAHFNTDTQDGSQSQTPTPTLDQPFSLFGSAIPPSVPAEKQEKNVDKMKPPEIKDNVKKTSKQNSKSPEAAVSGATSTRRRSVRFKDEEKKPCSLDSKEPVELQTSKSDKDTENELTDNKILTRSTSSSQEKTNKALKDNVSDSKSDDNHITALDISSSIKSSEDKIGSENEKNKMLIEKDLDISINKSSSSDETKSQGRNTAESEKVSLSNQSIPQNVLGVIGLTPESSSKSAESKNDTLNRDDKELTCIEQDDESQPLFSWTQKLNQLNKSPRNQSPLKQVLSQDIKSSSQRTRSQSPSKSPRRSKKKQGNETFGNLDKWIIRSPGKEISNACEDKVVETEITVASTTIVEETQSPSKFVRDKKYEEDPKMESVMETPPKHNFCGSNINSFGNSNRKLFQSSQDNIENMHDHVEDSNIIAASPNSKSFTTCKITGTPLLKLTRLTDSEIKKYSPSREGKKELDLTPRKSDSEMKKSSTENKAVKTINIEGDPVETKSSENLLRHDDFSAFKPLENDSQGNLETDGFFSKSITDTEQAMLKLSEGERSADTDSEKMDVSQSDSELVEGSQSLTESSDNTDIKGLFSQIVKEAKLEAEQFKNDMPFEASADIFTQDSKATDSLALEISPASQDESQKESKENVHVMESENESKANRKRKQETPKKTTPEDLKKGRKKKTVENSQPLEFGSATKVSRRLQEKRERKETEKRTSSASDSKKGDEKAVTDEKLSKNEDTKFDNQTIKKTGRKGLNQVSVEMAGSVDSQTLEESTAEINTNIMTAKPMTDLTGNLMSPKSKWTVSKAKKEQGTPNVKTIEVVTEKVSDQSSMKKHDLTNENMSEKQTESRCNDPATPNIPSKVDELEKVIDTSETDNKTDLKKRKSITCSQEESIQEKGQKTPESRNSSAQPERKSTTKKKKAVAQKRVLKRESKDVVVNESDSNLDQDLSDDDIPLADTKKAIAENLEKKIDEQLSAEHRNEKKQKSDKIKNEKLDKIGEIMAEKVNDKNQMKEDELQEVHEAMDISFGSDDDIPLSNIKSSQEKKSKKAEKLGSKKQESVCFDKVKTKKCNPKIYAKKEKETKTSPVGNKLRSSKVVKTRLRSGDSKIMSPPKSKKSLSLAVKRVNDAKKKLKVGNKKKEQSIDLSEIERDAALLNEAESKSKIVSQLLDKENNDTDLVEEVKDTNGLKEPETPVSTQEMRKSDISLNQVSDFAGMKDASTNVIEIADRPVNPVFNILDETPTKGKESPKRLATSILMRNSDSKLVMGSRKFEKRPGFARRSILKPSSLGSANEIDSPKRTFHPIKVARIYSPTASPSASILKKRRLSGDSASDTNSPPAKQRRVSFAEPLTEMENVLTENVTTQSAVISSASESTQLDKPNIPAVQKPDTLTPASTCNTETQSTQATSTPNTYQTQESQLNDSEPVCPELVGCDHSVEKILPQLTSSIWSRGLGQLVRARNIHTVGHLSALTESEIDSLPIRSPKVQTVRKVLGTFGGTLQAKKTKLWHSPKPATLAKKSEADQSSTLDSSSREPSSQTGTRTLVDDNEKTDFLATDINKLLESSGDLVDEVNRLSQKINQSQDSKKLCDSQSQSGIEQKSCDTQKDQPGLAQQSGDLQSAQSKFMDLEGTSTEEVGYPSPSNPLLSSLSELTVKFKSGEGTKLRTEELFQAHQFISDLQNQVVTSIRTRCHSPTS